MRATVGALPLLLSIALGSISVSLATFTASTSSPGNTFTDLVVQPAVLAGPSAASAGAVQLAWLVSDTAATESVNYAVFRSPPAAGTWTQVASLVGLAYTDVPPSDGTWDYFIQAIVAAFTADGNVVTGLSDRTAPSAATGVAAATGTTRGTIAVTWTAGTDAGSGVKGYTIHYLQATICPAPAPASYPLTTSLVTGTSATLTGLATAKTYCLYAVTSDNAGNASAPSAVASAEAR